MSTKKIAFGGLLLSILLIVLYLSNIAPTARFSIFAFSSLLMATAAIELGRKYTWAFYLAASLLAILLPDKFKAAAFILFFGLYPVIRLYIDSIKNIFLEMLLKLVFFNLCLIVAVNFAMKFLISGIGNSVPIYLIFIVGQVVFLLYDYIFTSYIAFYFRSIKKHIRL